MFGDVFCRLRTDVARPYHQGLFGREMAVDMLHKALEDAHQQLGSVSGNLHVVHQCVNVAVLLVDERIAGF